MPSGHLALTLNSGYWVIVDEFTCRAICQDSISGIFFPDIAKDIYGLLFWLPYSW